MARCTNRTTSADLTLDEQSDTVGQLSVDALPSSREADREARLQRRTSGGSNRAADSDQSDLQPIAGHTHNQTHTAGHQPHTSLALPPLAPPKLLTLRCCCLLVMCCAGRCGVPHARCLCSCRCVGAVAVWGFVSCCCVAELYLQALLHPSVGVPIFVVAGQ